MTSEPRIIMQTPDWVAIDKPPGLVIHDVPGKKHAGSTLVDWLRENVDAISSNFSSEDWRPGIVHRLDSDTSGIVLVAKNPRTLKNLQDQFRTRSVKKTYQALVLGRVKNGGVWIGQIARAGDNTSHRVRRLSFSWDKKQAKPAETSYEPTTYFHDEEGRDYTLVELRPKTGRTHQLRVQALDAGYPIVGDQTYNTKASKEASTDLALGRQFLHASSLEFSDPETGGRIRVESPLANDLKRVNRLFK